MIRQAQQGFTIIELLLVVSIGGALTVALLIGSGTAINQQRYRDSVNTLKSYIQDQYDQVANTVNDRPATQGCGTNATINTTAQAVGSSDCVLVGRFVTIGANGKDLSSAGVLAYRDPLTRSLPGATDISDLQTYKLGVASSTPDTDTVAWNATVVKKGTTNPLSLSLLVVRAPLSGSIMTFAAPGVTAPTNLMSLVTTANNKTTQNLCVNPSSIAFAKQLAVQIPGGASNQGDIQVPLESSNVCG